MAQSIFGANNLNNPNSTVIGGSSKPRERVRADTKLSSRMAKSDTKTAQAKSNVIKGLTGRETP